MADVFISYSRRDQAFALQLVGALAQRDSSAWLDQTDVFPAGPFREDIQTGIEEAGAFLFLLSPDSAVSEECNKELDYAASCGKKLIPIVHREVSPSLVPQALRDLDWVTDASFDQFVEKVLNALLTDKDDWNRSGRWLRSANEWDKNHKQHSGLLLHGKELKKAEDWLRKAERWRSEGSKKKPQPSSLQIQFIRASRRATNRLLLVSILALLLLISFTGAGAFLLLYHNPTLVTSLNDNSIGSLRWAIGNAHPGDTISFAKELEGQTIVLQNADIHIFQQNLIIKGAATGQITIREIGASLIVDKSASVILSRLVFQGSNTTKGQPSLLLNRGKLTLTNCTVSGNTASAAGGGILNNGTLMMTSSTISGNVASNDGGGIFNDGILTIMNSTISGNTASSSGGGIYNNRGTLTITSSTLSNNISSGHGGGILNNGPLTITSSTVSNNTSSGHGGGITNGGTLAMMNSTVSGNTARATTTGNAFSSGGGISNERIGAHIVKVTLIFCTFVDNSASGHDGFDIGNSIQGTSLPQIYMKASVVGGNETQHNPIASVITSEGYNVIQRMSSSNFDASPAHATDRDVPDLTGVFGPRPQLQNNGGPTKTYQLIGEASNPALNTIPLAFCTDDNGHPILTDQRGMPRPGKNKQQCDSGAYESQG